MNVLISGGTGLLGNALIPALLAQQHGVWVLSRHPEAARVPSGAQLAGWDGRTAGGWGHLAGEVDVIINLSGESIGGGRWTTERKARIRTSRQEAGQALVSAIQQAAKRPALLIQPSGIGAYGPGADQVMDENAPRGIDYLSGVTADWEASTQLVEGLGVRRVIIRTGLVMAAQGGWMAPLLWPFRLFVGGPLGSGQQWWPWIHIQDYVGAVLFLMAHEELSGAINLVGPNPCRMAEFGEELAKVLKRPYWFPTPAFGLKLLLGEMSTLVLDGQRAIPRKLLEGGYVYRYPLLHPALEDLFG
jgi:uncharacterized protein